MKNMRRLDVVLSILNWNGGTIHQANEECSNCLERNIDILGMTSEEFCNFIVDLKTSYPLWVNFHREQDNV